MKRNLLKKVSLFLAATLVVTILAGCGGSSKEYPSKDITVMIPKSAGGGTDTSARAFMEFVSKKLPNGVNMVGVNNPDGNGVVSMEGLADADKDGYTIGMVVVEAAMMPHMGQMDRTVEDYDAICATIADPVALVVKADAPYNTAQEFKDYCLEHPGEVQIGNAGTVSSTYICAQKMEEGLGIEVTHVPYNDGTGPAVAALVGGHIDAVMATPGSVKSQVEAGELKYIAILADKRMTLFPDIPTFKEEVGFEFELLSWAAMCAPSDTDPDALEYLRTVFKEVAESDEFKEYMSNLGIEPVVIIGDKAQEMLEADSALYKEMLTTQ